MFCKKWRMCFNCKLNTAEKLEILKQKKLIHILKLFSRIIKEHVN